MSDIIEKIDTRELTRNGIVEKMDAQYLPKKYLKKIFDNINISQEECEEINKMLECNSQEAYQELLSIALEHKEILRYDFCPDIISYIKALKFISYINIGKSFVEAYVSANGANKEIMAMYLDNGKESKEKLKASALLYAKSKLVIKLQQALDYPIHLHFSGHRFEAVEVLHKEMKEAPLPKDRIQAADRLLAHLTPIMEQNNNLIINNINTDEKNIVDAYKDALRNFAKDKVSLLEQVRTEGKDIDVQALINLDIKSETKDD